VVERIDDDHANSRKRWEEMGAPAYLSADEVEVLHAASALVAEPHVWTRERGALVVELDLPAHAVAALTFTFAT
jgi:xylan 1,4-beta-xylosidase